MQEVTEPLAGLGDPQNITPMHNVAGVYDRQQHQPHTWHKEDRKGLGRSSSVMLVWARASKLTFNNVREEGWNSFKSQA